MMNISMMYSMLCDEDNDIHIIQILVIKYHNGDENQSNLRICI